MLTKSMMTIADRNEEENPQGRAVLTVRASPDKSALTHGTTKRSRQAKMA